LNIKSFTNNTDNINNKRNNVKYTKPIPSFPELGATSIRNSWTGLSSGQELDSGMHGSPSGSGSQVEQRAGSTSEGSHGRRERDPSDPPALTCVWRVWHGIHRWSISSPVRPSPWVWCFTAPHWRDLWDLPVTLAAIVIIINKGLFLHSFPTV